MKVKKSIIVTWLIIVNALLALYSQIQSHVLMIAFKLEFPEVSPSYEYVLFFKHFASLNFISASHSCVATNLVPICTPWVICISQL